MVISRQYLKKYEQNTLVIQFLFLILLSPVFVWSDLNTKMNDFFNSFDSVSNLTSGEVYEGQKAGYATGGGATVRNRVMNSKLTSIQLPEINAGCGGIDIYTGGFSFINSEEIISTLKAVGSNAVGYSFMLGLETVSPQVANNIRQLQSWANTINNIGINSCETAAQLVGSVWPKNTMAKEHICRAANGKKGMLNDYITARQQCNLKQNQSSGISREKFPDLLFNEYNIAWSALQKQTIFSSDQELAELFMSLMGTIVIKNDQTDNPEIFYYPSKMKDASFVKNLLNGGNINLYKCADKEQCLLISEQSVTVESSDSWTGKIKSKLLSIQSKILSDKELDNDEKSLLETSHLPIYKIINVLTAYKRGICPIDLYQLADIIAVDMLAQCFREGLELVRDGCRQLRNGQMYANEIDEYLKNLDQRATEIYHLEKRSSHLMDQEFQILQKMQMLEEQIASEITLF